MPKERHHITEGPATSSAPTTTRAPQAESFDTTHERPFAIDELFFSTTDPKGFIESGNEVFVRVSGYAADELIGRPHNVIRHPHTLRVVFRLLWEHIQAGEPIVAYVRNREIELAEALGDDLDRLSEAVVELTSLPIGSAA